MQVLQMNENSRNEVRSQFELFVKAFNTNDEYTMWRCFVWPYTEVHGSELLLRYKPSSSLSELKATTDWFYSQIISLDIHASLDTAHVIAHTARLDSVKHVTGEMSTMYVFKKISGEWKIFLMSLL